MSEEEWVTEHAGIPGRDTRMAGPRCDSVCGEWRCGRVQGHDGWCRPSEADAKGKPIVWSYRSPSALNPEEYNYD